MTQMSIRIVRNDTRQSWSVEIDGQSTQGLDVDAAMDLVRQAMAAQTAKPAEDEKVA